MQNWSTEFPPPPPPPPAYPAALAYTAAPVGWQPQAHPPTPAEVAQRQDDFVQGIVAGYKALIQNNGVPPPAPPRPPPPPVVPFAQYATPSAVAPAAAANSGWVSSVPRVQTREQAAVDAAARYSSNALQPLHPALTAARPKINFKLAQPIRFVSKGTINTDATQPAAASGSSASASASAAVTAAASTPVVAAPASHVAPPRHFARVRPSSTLPPLSANVAVSSPAPPPLTRLEHKLRTLLCSVLTATADTSLRLRDLSTALLTYTGEEWEDLTTQSLESFITQHSTTRGGPFRLQDDAQHPDNPLVSSVEIKSTEAPEQKSQGAVMATDVAEGSSKMILAAAEEPSAVVAASAASAASAAVAASSLNAIAAITSGPPSAAAVAASAFRSYCVLISNIPSTFHSADLRHFFSNLVEAGRFKVFQPTHRKEEAVAAETAAAEATDTTASITSEQQQVERRRFEAIGASAVAPPAPHAASSWKCMVQLRKKADVERMLSEYNDAEWVSRKGEHMGQRCVLKFIPLPRKMLRHTEAATAAASQDLTGDSAEGDVIDLTDDTAPSAPAPSSSSSSSAAAATATAPAAASPSTTSIEVDDETPEEARASREILAAYSAGEFAAPAFLPQGLVGTPTKIVHANIAHLPPSVLKRLHLTPAVESLNAKRFKFSYASSSSSSAAAAAAGLPAADVDDDPTRLAARARAQAALEENTQEEWDRDLDQGVRSTAWDSGRGLGKIGDQTSFEDAVDNPWDKGDASGLVHYTDAQREQESKGDFDEQNVDMFDVEVISDDDDDVQEDDGPEARARRKQLAAAKMRERMAESNVVSARQAAESAAAAASSSRERSLAWSKSAFLQKMMSKQGYQEGQGLGKRNQGIAEPIQPVNKGSTRGGLGFGDGGGGGSMEAAAAGGGARGKHGAPAGNSFYQQLSGKLKKKRKSYSSTNGGALGQGGYNQAADFRAYQRSQGLR